MLHSSMLIRIMHSLHEIRFGGCFNEMEPRLAYKETAEVTRTDGRKQTDMDMSKDRYGALLNIKDAVQMEYNIPDTSSVETY